MVQIFSEIEGAHDVEQNYKMSNKMNAEREPELH